MAEVILEVRNRAGLHARPAATFVRAAGAFHSTLQLTNLTRDATRSANAKSLLAVLGLGVSSGHRLRIVADGEDADAALRILAELVEAGLDEPLSL